MDYFLFDDVVLQKNMDTDYEIGRRRIELEMEDKLLRSRVNFDQTTNNRHGKKVKLICHGGQKNVLSKRWQLYCEAEKRYLTTRTEISEAKKNAGRDV